MQLRLLLQSLIVATSLMAAPAFAMHCPNDIKKIDQILSTHPPADPDLVAQVKKLRDEGEALHKAGKHQEAVDTLAKALSLLQGE